MSGGTRREFRQIQRKRRRTLSFLIPAALLVSGVAVVAPAFGSSSKSVSASKSGQRFAFRARAWGTQLNVGRTVTSGRSALVVLGCTSRVGVTHANTVASVKVPQALGTGTIVTTAASKTVRSGVEATSSATTQGLNLLGGEIKAKAISSVSSTLHTSSTGKFSTSAAGTNFVHLVIAGHAMGGTPAPNTKVTLPGIGYVVLNQQSSHVHSTSASMSVIAIHLVVTQNTKNAKSGTQAFVSVAKSGLNGPVTGVLNGLAFGTSATVGGVVKAGRSFPEYMPCLGTNGAKRTNKGVGASIPGVIKPATITDTVVGTVNSSTDSGATSSKVQNVNLLGGMITASVIKADVTAKGKPPTLKDHSSFIGLHVSGHPEINDNAPPNTQVNLPGLGTLWLHRVVKSKNKIRVTMIQLIVNNPNNSAGVPSGTKVNVGFASVGVS
jgi:hypothetical protein